MLMTISAALAEHRRQYAMPGHGGDAAAIAERAFTSIFTAADAGNFTRT